MRKLIPLLDHSGTTQAFVDRQTGWISDLTGNVFAFVKFYGVFSRTGAQIGWFGDGYIQRSRAASGRMGAGRSFSAIASRNYLEGEFLAGDALVFGKESVGLDPDLLERHEDAVFGIPTMGAVRSLNLANAVGIALYEGLRQIGALAPVFVD